MFPSITAALWIFGLYKQINSCGANSLLVGAVGGRRIRRWRKRRWRHRKSSSQSSKWWQTEWKTWWKFDISVLVRNVRVSSSLHTDFDKEGRVLQCVIFYSLSLFPWYFVTFMLCSMVCKRNLLSTRDFLFYFMCKLKMWIITGGGRCRFFIKVGLQLIVWLFPFSVHLLTF